MANASDASSRLQEMTLKDNNDEQELESVNLELIPTQDSDLEYSSVFTFENVIGHLEDMLIDENFLKLQNGFLEKYWEEFENNEENKHSYMTIFNEYTNVIEDFISEYLQERVTNFDMETFANELHQRKNSLEGEIFEVLLTLSDFTAFKEIFLDYRAMKEGHTTDLCNSLSVSSIPH